VNVSWEGGCEAMHPCSVAHGIRHALSVAFGVALVIGSLARHPSAQTPDTVETVAVKSGAFVLRGLMWRPAGSGPFPAVLFNHGSYSTRDPMPPNEPAVLGHAFTRHGYALLFLFRQGIGLSAGQGTADGDLMARAAARQGERGRNREQLRLLETEELNEAAAALALLRRQRGVDPQRIILAGHSFGGSLSLVLAARDRDVRSVVVFAAAAQSWGRSPVLRTRLRSAVGRMSAPAMFVHAANDYSVTPGEELAAEMQRLGKSHLLKVFPAAGRTTREGHNFVFRGVATWEADVFAYLDAHVRR
jgi:carboxymethylenebutenolidase